MEGNARCCEIASLVRARTELIDATCDNMHAPGDTGGYFLRLWWRKWCKGPHSTNAAGEAGREGCHSRRTSRRLQSDRAGHKDSERHRGAEADSGIKV